MLVAWLPPRYATTRSTLPKFFELTLIPTGPSPPCLSAPPPLGCRVVDFAADVCFDESLMLGGEGSDADGGDDWLTTILGQFRETGRSPPVPRATGLRMANEAISGLTADTTSHIATTAPGKSTETSTSEEGAEKAAPPRPQPPPETTRTDQATYQLILAQQQHLYVLQRQVQELQALLQRQPQPDMPSLPLSTSIFPPHHQPPVVGGVTSLSRTAPPHAPESSSHPPLPIPSIPPEYEDKVSSSQAHDHNVPKADVRRQEDDEDDEGILCGDIPPLAAPSLEKPTLPSTETTSSSSSPPDRQRGELLMLMV